MFRKGDPNYGSEFGIWSKVGFGSRSGLPVGLGSLTGLRVWFKNFKMGFNSQVEIDLKF